jgi:endo-1,4-beta-xylanase
MGVSRRKLLSLMAGVAGAGSVTAASATGRGATSSVQAIAALPSLGAIAAARGVLFGTAIDADTLSNPVQAALYLHHARIFTSDTIMKFAALRPQEGPADFQMADRLVAFAAQAKIPLRGHCLIWNEYNPDWVSRLSRSRRAYWFDRHIDEVVGRYAGQLYTWDVVNEPIWPSHGNTGALRNGPWLDALGPGYVTRAMKRARAADPTGRIALNEAGPEWEQSFSPAQPYRAALLALVDEVQHAGVKLDLVGLQCHWFPEFTFNADHFRTFLHEIAQRGPRIHLSEIDINDANFGGGDSERDNEVAQRYTRLVSAALLEPAVEAIITWQLCDGASWLMGESKLWGIKGQKPRPLPFDRGFQPKAAYHALARVFGSAPLTGKKG